MFLLIVRIPRDVEVMKIKTPIDLPNKVESENIKTIMNNIIKIKKESDW